MAQILNTDDVKQLGTILFVAAHPDDETFTAGGLLAAAAQNGQTVIVLTATKGEGGIQDESRWPADQLAQIRSSELAQALEIIGCAQHYWLDYADGGCATDSPDRAVQRIKELITEQQVDSIVTFGPDGLTGHPDHQTVSAWAAEACGDLPVYHVVEELEGYETYMKPAGEQFNWYFNIQDPPMKLAADCQIAFKLSPELRDLKLKALAAMPSQYEKLFTDTPPNLLEHLFTIECFVQT